VNDITLVHQNILNDAEAPRRYFNHAAFDIDLAVGDGRKR
jgi:hypothetical protein